MVLLGLAMTPVTSRADLSITEKNNPQPDEVNILFNNPNETGTTVLGNSNTSPAVSVSFQTLAGQTLTGSDANGQAKLSTSDDSLLQGVKMFTTNGASFLDMIFDLHTVDHPTGFATQVTIRANGFAADGTTPESLSQTFTDLGSGNQFFTVLASNGETLSSVQFTFPDSTGITDLVQPRISGLQGVTPIPEPSTMAIAGLGALGLIGYGIRRRRGA